MLSPEQIHSFQTRGFCVIEHAMSPAQLDAARAAADALVEAANAGRPYPPSFLREGESYNAISKAGSRLFFSNRCETFPDLERFIKGELMGAIAADLIGNDAHLFNEQMVVKAPQHGDSFAWHQDSGYIRFAHRPYLTLWCALDDSHRDNGTVFIIPRDIRSDLSVNPHEWDDAGANLVGYQGDEPGDVVEVPAGSVVAFSSVTMHRTGANRTDKPRRALVCQYTDGPLLRPDTGRPHNRAVKMPVPATAAA
jgi:ectoine hydroxylase-related dioxygenase (phytanoyl-CoA dioxygenase family)